MTENHGREARGHGKEGDAPEFEGEGGDDVRGHEGQSERGGDRVAGAVQAGVADGGGDAEEETDGRGGCGDDGAVFGGAEEAAVPGQLQVPLEGETAPFQG